MSALAYRTDRNWLRIPPNTDEEVHSIRVYVEIKLICNFHPGWALNATTIISKLNNFTEVLAVPVHVDVYMATVALRSITGKSLCDTGQGTLRNLPTTTYPPPNPSTLNQLYLFLFCGFATKNIDGKI